MVLNENFLSGLEGLPPPQNQQQTFMEIAGYPHFENVCSNIFQFYLTPTNEHGFGRLFLDSLVMLIDRELVTDEQSIEVWREVSTSENKRIDLVIVSDSYIIGIENKVRAKVNNPFCDYTIYLNSLSGGFKKTYKILLAEVAAFREDMRMKLKQLEQLIAELEISAHFKERWFWTHPTFFGDMLIYTIDPDKSPLYFAIILTSLGWKMQFWSKKTDLERNTGSEKEGLKKWFEERSIEYKEVTGHSGSGWRLEVDGFKDKAYDTKLEEIIESIGAIWKKLNKDLQE